MAKIRRLPARKVSRIPVVSPLDNMTMGQRIKMLRTRKGWTVQDLADSSGMVPSGVTHLETGRTLFPGVDVFYCIAYGLGVSMEYLLFGQEIPEDLYKLAVKPTDPTEIERGRQKDQVKRTLEREEERKEQLREDELEEKRKERERRRFN